eukprot:903855-Pleurochrysis_carterae.AAC.1
MVTGGSSNYQSPTLAAFFKYLTLASGYPRLEEPLTQQLYHSQLAEFLFSPTSASPPLTADATGHADWLDEFKRVIMAIRVEVESEEEYYDVMRLAMADVLA